MIRSILTTLAVTAGQLDVYASAFPGMSPRIRTGGPPLTGAAPLLVFYDGPCVLDANGALIAPPVGDAAHQMFSGPASPSDYWGQSPPCDIAGAGVRRADERRRRRRRGGGRLTIR